MIFRGDAVGYVVGGDLDPDTAGGFPHRPRHRHGPGELGCIGDEVHRLNHPLVRDDVEVANVDDVGVG